MRSILLVLSLLLCAACAPMNGVLSVNIKQAGDPELHDIYRIMRTNGFLMKEPNSRDTFAQERWDTSLNGLTTSGAFMDPAFPNLVVVVMNFKDDGSSLWAFFTEDPKGFSAEGQTRTDKAVRDLKRKFGDRINITERRNYTGTE